MRTLLNIIWLVLAGFWLFLEYILFGTLAFIFIITIPAAIACYRIAFFVLWPFGKAVVEKRNAGVGSALMNLVWFCVAGAWLALGHIVTAFALAITIIGIPLAIGNLKILPVTCFPFGKEVVSVSEARRRGEPYVAL